MIHVTNKTEHHRNIRVYEPMYLNNHVTRVSKETHLGKTNTSKT